MKHRTLAKAMAILVSIFLLFGFAGCAEEAVDEPDVTTTTAAATTTTTAATTTTEPEVEAHPFEEHMRISYLVRFTHNYEDGRWDQRELEEKFNVTLDVWTIDAFNTEQVMMMVAAGDWADTGYVNRFHPIDAYNEGLTRSISLDMIRDHLPGYYAALQDNPIGYRFNLIEGTDDEYYGLSFNYAMNNYWYHVNAFRLDWLENIGYSFDDLQEIIFNHEGLQEVNQGTIFLSNTPVQYEEFLDIMEQFTVGDPNDTSMDDTFGSLWPLDHPTYGSHWSDVYTAMFGFDKNNGRWLPDTWLYYDEATGDYLPSHATTRWRDFLIFITDMFDRGYMQHMPDITGTGNFGNNFYGNLNTGAYGHFVLDVLYNMNPNNVAAKYRFPGGVLEDDPDARFVVVPAILGPEGQGGNVRYVPEPFRDGPWGTWTFGYGAEDEAKFERILAMMEYTHFNQDAWYRYHYGLENVHYTWSGEPHNSAILLTPRENIPHMYSGGEAIQALFSTDKFLSNFRDWSMQSDWLFQLSEYQVTHGWFEQYTLEPDKISRLFYMGTEMYDEYMELRYELIDDVHAVADDFRNRAWRGELADIYLEWGEYINQLYSAGLDRFVEIFNREDFEYYEIDTSVMYRWD